MPAECIDDNDAALFVSGELDEPSRERVERHVDECNSCRVLVTELARQTGTPPPSERTEALLPPGASVGRYLIGGLVGAGGMGVVYSAEDPQLGRKVALKLLRPRHKGEVDVSAATELPALPDGADERLLAEAQTLARLAHPNVVTIFDAGRWRDRVFIALELVRGGTLREWLGRKRTLSEVLDHFRAAGAGLAAAHAEGIIHRDFKPDNVLCGDDGRVRVTDFGLARSMESPSESGVRVGTPAYMPPEQRHGGEADARSDQYSFCVALHEALYGELPAAQGAQKRDGHVMERVPRRIRRAVERGLLADPAARFPSMGALLDELKWDPRAGRRRAALALALTLMAGVGGLALRSYFRARPCNSGPERFAQVLGAARRSALDPIAGRTFSGPAAEAALITRRDRLAQLDGYQKEWIGQYSEACTATRVRGDQSDEVMELRMSCLNARLEGVDALVTLLERNDLELERRLAGRTVLEPLTECGDRAALLQPIRLPRDPVMREKIAAARAQLGRLRVRMQAGELRAGLAEAKRLLEEARTLGYPPLVAEALYRVAVGEDQSGDPAAERDYRETALLAEAAHDDRFVAGARVALVWVVGVRNGKVEEGKLLAREAEAAINRIGGDEAYQNDLLNNRALLAESDPAEAEKLYQQLIERLADAKGELRLDLGRAENNLGDLYLDSGRNGEALTHFERAITIEGEMLGSRHPAVLLVRRNLMMALGELGKLKDTTEEARRIVIDTEAAVGADNLDVGYSLELYAHALSADPARRAEALPLYARAAAIFAAKLPPDSGASAEVDGLWCEDLVALTRYGEAGPHCDAALAFAQKNPGVERRDLRQALLMHADYAAKSGQKARAKSELQQALELGRK